MRRLVPCTLAGLLVLGLGGRAALAETRAAVLSVEAVDAPVELASRLSEGLRAQVRQSPGFTLIPGRSLEEIKLVFGCVDEKPDCMTRVGQSLGVRKLIWGTLRKSGPGYNLTIKVLDVPSGTIEKFVSENVSAADLEAANAPALIERLTRSFLPTGRASLRISSNVEGAQVEVDGKAAGITRPEGLVLPGLRPGRVAVRVVKPGYRTWAQSVVVSPGETAYVDAQLEGAPEVPATASQPVVPPPRVSRGRTGWKAAFWTTAALTVGLGGAFIGTGVTVLHYQGEKDTAANDYINEKEAGSTEYNTRKAAYGEQAPDVCQAADADPNLGSDSHLKNIKSACDSGNKWATATNVLWPITIVTGVVSAFFLYKAYLQKDSAEEQPPGESVTRRPEPPSLEWMVAPSLGPTGGGVGLHLRW